MPLTRPSNSVDSTSSRPEHTAPVGATTESELVFTRGVTGARLHTEQASDRLFTASFSGRQPAVIVDGRPAEKPAAARAGPAAVHIRYRRGTRPRDGRVALNSTVTWAIRIDKGAKDLDADLTGTRLSAIRIAGSANQVELRLPAARGRVPVLVEGGINNVTIHRPAGSGATLTIHRGGTDVTFDGRQFGYVTSGNRIESAAGSGADGYDIRGGSGATNLTVTTDRSTEDDDSDGGAREPMAVLLTPAQLDDAADRWLPRMRRRATNEYLFVFASMAVALVLGLTFFWIGSRLPESFFALALTEVGIALWTAVFVVLFLQLGVEALKWYNRWSISETERILTEHGRPLPPDPAAENEPGATADKLDRVLARLDELEQRLAERDRNG